MWLVYFRFDDQGEVVTMHVRTDNKRSVDALVKCAEQHGLTSTSKLVEFMAFYASGTIKRPQPSSKFYDHNEFSRKWESV